MVKTVDNYKKEYLDLKSKMEEAKKNGDSTQETYYRGKLIKTIRVMLFKFRDDLSFVPSEYKLDDPAEYKKENAEVICDSAYEYYLDELKNLLKCHVVVISDMIEDNKKDRKKYSISEEAKLKICRAATSIRLSKVSSECENNNFGHDFFGIIWSVSKFGLLPIIWLGGNAVSLAAAVPGVLVGIPVDVVRNVFGYVVNSKENVDFKMTKKFGGTLFKKTKERLQKVNDSIIRR